MRVIELYGDLAKHARDADFEDVLKRMHSNAHVAWDRDAAEEFGRHCLECCLADRTPICRVWEWENSSMLGVVFLPFAQLDDYRWVLHFDRRVPLSVVWRKTSFWG